jgi:putative transposase
VTEAADAGESMAERTAWRICSTNGWWSAFGKKRGKNGKPGPPVHDDLVGRDFTADAPNQLWLSDITEHRTGEGKLCLCAIKDMLSNRIVGYSIDSRMKSRLATTALASAVRSTRRRRRLHPARRQRQPISQPKIHPCPRALRHGRVDGPRWGRR